MQNQNIDLFVLSCLHLLCKTSHISSPQDTVGNCLHFRGALSLMVQHVIPQLVAYYPDIVLQDGLPWGSHFVKQCLSIFCMQQLLWGKKSSFIFLRRAVIVILSLLASFISLKVIVVLARTPSAHSAVEWLSSGSLMPTISCGFWLVYIKGWPFVMQFSYEGYFMGLQYFMH